MAYISTEKTKEIREELKKNFPSKEGWKFSVVKEHYSSLCVTIVKAPFKFTESGKGSINHFYPENYNQPEKLSKIISILNGEFLSESERNFDKSDAMTDYFHVGWYISISENQINPSEVSLEKVN